MFGDICQLLETIILRQYDFVFITVRVCLLQRYAYIKAALR